jgi:hypothetical protein
VIPKGGKCSNQIIELVYLMMDNVWIFFLFSILLESIKKA